MQDYSLACAYIETLTGQPADIATVEFRLIHDTNKAVPAHHFRGVLPQLWQTIVNYQSNGYGAYVNINELDGAGRELSNVQSIRAHIVDLDNSSAPVSYSRAAAWQPAPTFAVQTSPGKFHVYWCVDRYQGNERYESLQRRLRQLFDGDGAIIDPTRVARLPGTLHLKNPTQPHLVTCWAIAGHRFAVEALEHATQHVNVFEHTGGRHALGDAELAAPSLDWLRFALSLIDPNELSRGEWISTTAAIKQAGWTLTDEQTLFDMWSEWCARYEANDAAENLKQWNSIRDTEVGWKALKGRAPTINAYERFGGVDRAAPAPVSQTPPMPDADGVTRFDSDILSPVECELYFKNCYYIERMGEIFTPGGRFMNATKFNGKYGGHQFIVTRGGKLTDEPWKAALRSTEYTIPKVDHVRFLPDEPSFSIVEDDIGRRGVNTYIPIKSRARQGDVSPWLNHIAALLPDPNDREIFFKYLAHSVKFPGFKIPWAPMIQSVEGAGKGFIRQALQAVIGSMYCYSPKAPELVKSGSVFNAWMRGKLLIIVDEIKIDERRELIEILKPMITDSPIEIQAKGIDQDLEDNPANWLFFSNHKDAIPIDQNGRRYAIFYSALQTAADLSARGMDGQYFPNLFKWLETGGADAIAYWLHSYPVERGGVPMRAPETSSHAEAVRLSRGPIEVAICNAVEDGVQGFRGGYVSTLAVMNRLQQTGVRRPAMRTVQNIIEKMGYHDIGRAVRQYGQEGMHQFTQLYAIIPELPAHGYGLAQGYGD